MFVFLVSFFMALASLVTASPINGRTPPAWKFNSQLPHNGSELNESQAQPFYITFPTIRSGVTDDNYFEACIPTPQAWACNVAAYIDDTYYDAQSQFWSFALFDHNCVMIGENPSVYAGDLITGWGFSSELPCYTTMWIPYPPEREDFP
jgi:hypothetical protein